MLKKHLLCDKMYVGNQKNGDEFHALIIHSIRELGIKPRFKKCNVNKGVHDAKRLPTDSRVFKKPLSSLKTQTVALKSGPVIEIPVFVAETCLHIKQSCDVEGIFRKAGSAARLREIKAFVDSGKKLDLQHHVVDVSNILTLFFRELPEPLLPYNFHDLLLRCLLVNETAIDGILLTCLLFPSLHLNTLAYVMEFFKEIADHKEINKMSITNLAIIITPSLMPVEEKLAFTNSTRLNHHVQVIECLLENTEKIGFLPNHLFDRALSSGCLAIMNEEENDENDSSKVKKKKKRRSGSLTRMINGLKKIVGKGSPDDSAQAVTSTPDFSSPCVKSAKKRKVQESSGAFSSKKKREILQALPQSCALADAPCTPLPGALGELHYTPKIQVHPNPCEKSKSPLQKRKPRRFFSPKRQNDGNDILPTVKSESRLKCRLNMSKKSSKKNKQAEGTMDEKTSDISCQSDKPKRSSLDWQWGAGPWRRKKCLSSSDTPSCADLTTDAIASDSLICSNNSSCTTSVFDAGVDLSDTVSSNDASQFVKISKSEYEEIKNRVSAIENRISQEFGCIASNPENIKDIPLIDESDVEIGRVEKVQDAYQKTLQESEKLDTTVTDQLAKRLSRELKIRTSLENKVIRSPSARKIGTIRRRSRENAKVSMRSSRENLVRTGAWQSAPPKRENSLQASPQESIFYPRGTLRRGRPNTIYTGLPHPSPLRALPAGNSETLVCNHDLDHLDERNLEMDTTSGECETNSVMMTQEMCPAFKADQNLENPLKNCEVRRASSFHGTDAFPTISDSTILRDIKKSVSQMDISQMHPESQNVVVFATPQNTHWESAQQFFKKKEKQTIPVTGRESVVRIRSQNAGMVLARMRMFDGKRDPDGTPKRANCPRAPGGERPVQSLRVQCMQDNFLGKLSTPSRKESPKRRGAVGVSSPVKQPEVVRGSPKKMGSPRKKYHNHKSPRCVSSKKQKLRPPKSPQKVEKRHLRSSNECNLKKFNSLRVASQKSPLPSKGNVTAPPGSLDCGKENIGTPNNANVASEVLKMNIDSCERILPPVHLPDNLKETIYDVCTPRIEKLHKMSMSPLRDCNRIDVNGTAHLEGNRPNSTYKSARSTPYIKKPLLTKSPGEFTRTPYLTPDHSARRLATPLRALPQFSSTTPHMASHRQSPHILSGKQRNLLLKP